MRHMFKPTLFLPLLCLGALVLCLAAPSQPAGAQPAIGPGPDGEPKPEEKKGGSLKPRPADDVAAASWVARLTPARPQAAPVDSGRLLRHCLSPDGSRLYYFRDLNAPAPAKPLPGAKRSLVRQPLPAKPRFVLFSAGPSSTEVRVLETGFDAIAPLFLPDGRLLLVTRKTDFNGDGNVDENDDRSLISCNADGSSEREIATLRPSESPLAVWRGGKEVLLADYSREEVNGWIMTLPLAHGERTLLTRGFNVSLVLDDNQLVIERIPAPEPVPASPENPWMRRWPPPGEDEIIDDTEPPPQATILDRSEHVIFNPADGSEAVIYNPSQRARLLVYAEGSFFGYQQTSRNLNPGRMPGGGWIGQRALESMELLIVDDATHYDLRAPQARNDYFPLAWVSGKGLLALERSNLRSKLVLVDRSEKLNMLPITEFGFEDTGFCASSDGLTLAWLRVEDSNGDGFLNPWQDNSRPWFVQIAPR